MAIMLGLWWENLMVMLLGQWLVEEEQKERNVEKAIKEKHEEKMSHEKQIDAEETKLRKIREVIKIKNNEIMNLKNEEENEAPPDISALEDDLEKCKEKLDDLAQQLV